MLRAHFRSVARRLVQCEGKIRLNKSLGSFAGGFYQVAMGRQVMLVISGAMDAYLFNQSFFSLVVAGLSRSPSTAGDGALPPSRTSPKRKQSCRLRLTRYAGARCPCLADKFVPGACAFMLVFLVSVLRE